MYDAVTIERDDAHARARKAEARIAELEKAFVDVFCLLHDGTAETVQEAYELANKMTHTSADPREHTCSAEQGTRSYMQCAACQKQGDDAMAEARQRTSDPVHTDRCEHGACTSDCPRLAWSRAQRTKEAVRWPPGSIAMVDGQRVEVLRLQQDAGIDSVIKPPHGRHVRFENGAQGLYHVDDLAPCVARPNDAKEWRGPTHTAFGRPMPGYEAWAARQPTRDPEAVEELITATLDFMAFRGSDNPTTAVPFMRWRQAMTRIDREGVRKADARLLEEPEPPRPDSACTPTSEWGCEARRLLGIARGALTFYADPLEWGKDGDAIADAGKTARKAIDETAMPEPCQRTEPGMVDEYEEAFAETAAFCAGWTAAFDGFSGDGPGKVEEALQAYEKERGGFPKKSVPADLLERFDAWVEKRGRYEDRELWRVVREALVREPMHLSETALHEPTVEACIRVIQEWSDHDNDSENLAIELRKLVKQ